MTTEQIRTALKAYLAAVLVNGGEPTPTARRAGIEAALRALMLVSAMLLCSVAHSEELPDAPFSSSSIEPVMLAGAHSAPRPHTDRLQWSLMAVDASLRMSDAYSTRWFLTHTTAHELVLPDCISHHTPAIYAYSATVVGFDWLLARELERHGHPKLARLPYIVDIGVELPTLDNFALPNRPVVKP